MLQLLGRETRGDVLHGAASDELGELVREGRGHDRHARMRGEQPFDFAMRNLTSSDDDGGRVLQRDEYGQIIHRNLDAIIQPAATAASRVRGCSPHSRDTDSSHHQRPARCGSPGWIARVQGAQPMLG